MTPHDTVSLGDLVSVFYEEFLALYGDEELAAVAASTTINELLADGHMRPEGEEVAA